VGLERLSPTVSFFLPTPCPWFSAPATPPPSEHILKHCCHANSTAYDTISAVVSFCFAAGAKIFLETTQHVHVTGRETFDYWTNRHKSPQHADKALITVMNHTSIFDDPCALASVHSFWHFFDKEKHRYVIVARDMCFSNIFVSFFFRCFKSFPVSRGGGVAQEDMLAPIAALNHGHYLHLFPEGRVYQDGDVHPARLGVGRLIFEAEKTPVVLPIYHKGMENVKPMRKMVCFGQKVRIIVGEPLFLDDVVALHRLQGTPKVL